MTASEVLAAVKSVGAHFVVDGAVLRLKHAERVPPGIKTHIPPNKTAIMALLQVGHPLAPPDADLRRQLGAAVCWLRLELQAGHNDSDALILEASAKGWSEHLLRLAAGRLKLVSSPTLATPRPAHGAFLTLSP
jgi:hypothetical protein